MAELKTQKTDENVQSFLNKIADESVRKDAEKIASMMEKATGAEPRMWGAAIVGFGARRLKYASGREQDWMEIGFSPRKQNLTLYLNIEETWDEDLLSKLGKHKTGKGCLYFKKLSDIDESVLDDLIEKSVETIRGK